MVKALAALGVVLILTLTVWFFFFSGYSITNTPAKNSTVLAFGDSLVEGQGSSSGGFVSLLSKKLGVAIINKGVGGNTTEQALARLEESRKLQPGIVIILLGGNDALQKVSKETTFKNLETIIRGFQADGAVIVLLGVRGGMLGDPYDDAFEDLAKRTGQYMSQMFSEDSSAESNTWQMLFIPMTKDTR